MDLGFVDGVFPVMSPTARQIFEFVQKVVDLDRLRGSLDTLPPTRTTWDDLISVAVQLRLNKKWNPIIMANRSYMAWKVFQEMRSQTCKPNICTYTAMVNTFARDGLCEKAEEVFEQLQEDGYALDVYAYNALTEAYRLI